MGPVLRTTRSTTTRKVLKTLFTLPPSTKLLDDFYVIDVETAWCSNPRQNYETYNGKLHWQLKATPSAFKFAVIYGLNFHKVLYSVDDVKRELLLPRYKKRKVYAHNGGNYDYPCIYGNIYKTDPKALFNGKFISFTNGNCTLVDSLNIFVGTSVKEIGKMTGTEKLGMSRDYTYSKWPRDKARDVNGCIRDCVIVWDALFSVFEFAGDIKITQAALSMTYFRREHQPFHIQYNENVIHFWDSYYGGRTEAFKIGETHASVIDINSSYPYQLKNCTFPNPKTLKYEKNIHPTKFTLFAKFFEGCCDATIYHPPSKFGYLPYKEGGKLLFPIGEFRGTWNFNELSFAIQKGGIEIRKIHNIIYGEKMRSPFIGFVDHLQTMKFNAKLSGNLLEEDRAKRFSNSLYGKFAQRISEEFIYIENRFKQFEEIRDYQRKGIFNRLVMFNKDRKDCFLVSNCSSKMPSYAIPSFSSYITSAARVELLKKMLEYEHRKIVYCDTDSIFFEVMDNSIVSSNELGGWKVEDKIVTKIYGLKNYRYVSTEKATEEKRRLKGVPTDKGRKTVVFNEDSGARTEFNSVEQTGDNEFRYWNLLKTKEAIRRGLEPGVLTERVKKIKNTYDKRMVLANGETKPIEL